MFTAFGLHPPTEPGACVVPSASRGRFARSGGPCPRLRLRAAPATRRPLTPSPLENLQPGCLRFSSSTVILEMTSSPARAPVDRPAPRLRRAVHSLALWMGRLSTGRRAAPKARRRRTVSTWGCKPEPPKIPAENVARDVSGHFGYPTRFSMQVLAVKVGRLWSGHASAGKQLFSGLSGGSNLVEQVGMAI